MKINMGVLLICLLAIMAMQARGDPVPGPRVNVNEGILEGITVRYQEDTQLQVDKQVDAFLGVPFADPPVRFAPPEPKTPWEGMLEAKEFKPACQQAPSPIYPEQSEDCLYLNVYAPSPKPSNAAVMVWIHGGGFSEGSAMSFSYTGGPIVGVGDVILVAINYRLSIFGTFTTRDEAAPGNVGMLDQVSALRWVYENIEAFGGDMERITIFGESAGAASVSFHLLSKLSRDYFSQAIMQSGSALSTWALSDNAELEGIRIQSLAAAMNCDAENTTLFVQCLRAKDAEELRVAAQRIYPNSYVTVDGTFLEDTPTNLYQRNDFKKLPMIAGFNKDEGTIYTRYDILPQPPLSGEDFREKIVSLLGVVNITNEVVRDVVLQEYMDWTIADDPDADYYQAVVDFVTDVQFACSTDSELRFHSEGSSPLFKYFFTHVPSKSIFGVGQDPMPWLGAGHAEELPLVFGWPFIEEMRIYADFDLTDQEKALSHKIIQFWTNFAKSGDPSKASVSATPSKNEESWPAFDLLGLRYKELSTKLGEGKAIKARKCAFWREYFPKVIQFAADSEGTVVDNDGEVDRETESDNQGQSDSREVLVKYRELLEEWRTEFASYVSRKNNRCNE